MNKLKQETQERRYNLTMPEAYLARIEEVAAEEHTQASDIIRRFVTLGLIAAETEKRGGSFVLRQDGRDEEMLIFPALRLRRVQAAM